MNNVVRSWGRPKVVAALAAGGVLLAVVGLGGSPGRALADQNPNSVACHGFVPKGDAEADDPGATQVAYTFGCNGPITPLPALEGPTPAADPQGQAGLAVLARSS